MAQFPNFGHPLCLSTLDPPVVPFYPFCGEGSPTKIDDRKTNRVPTYSNLSTREDLGHIKGIVLGFCLDPTTSAESPRRCFKRSEVAGALAREDGAAPLCGGEGAGPLA